MQNLGFKFCIGDVPYELGVGKARNFRRIRGDNIKRTALAQAPAKGSFRIKFHMVNAEGNDTAISRRGFARLGRGNLTSPVKLMPVRRSTGCCLSVV